MMTFAAGMAVGALVCLIVIPAVMFYVIRRVE